MAESMLFGGYRGGYRVLPEGWMQAATAPGQNYADAIKSFAGSIASGIKTGMEGKAEYQTTAGSIPSQYKMYEQTAEVTGVPIDPTLTERYRNMDNLSLPEMKGLAKDIAGAQQNAIALANMQRQQQQYNMQMEAARRGMAVQQLGRGVDQFLDNPMIPAPVQQQQVSSPAAPAYSTAPPPSNFIFRGNDASSMVPNVGTLSGMRLQQ